MIGDISSLTCLIDMKTLILNYISKLTGNIISFLPMTKLIHIEFAWTKLSGELKELSKLTHLTHLNANKTEFVQVDDDTEKTFSYISSSNLQV